eukprot:5368760-Pyramimonas_sp.AAC.1
MAWKTPGSAATHSFLSRARATIRAQTPGLPPTVANGSAAGPQQQREESLDAPFSDEEVDNSTGQ